MIGRVSSTILRRTLISGKFSDYPQNPDDVKVEFRDGRSPIFIPNSQFPSWFSPWFIVGLVEAEGCFDVKVSIKQNKRGYTVTVRFSLCLNYRDVQLLFMLKNYFNCGNIGKVDERGVITYAVTDIGSIMNILIPFFLSYPLRGTKYLDFLSFKQAAELFINKAHLTEEGFKALLAIKNSMNTNRIVPSNYQPNHCNPSSLNYIPLDGNYISGFIAGDGSLSLITKHYSLTSSDRFGQIGLFIYQHVNNKLLLETFVPFFESELSVQGQVVADGPSKVRISIMNLNVFLNVIIPFFELYPLYGVKSITLLKLIDIATIINDYKLNFPRKPLDDQARKRILNIWNNNESSLNSNGQLDSRHRKWI